MICPHARTEFGRIIARNGEQHVMERCCNCFTNVRGPGVWVPHDALPTPLEAMPVFADHRPQQRTPGGLFGEVL